MTEDARPDVTNPVRARRKIRLPGFQRRNLRRVHQLVVEAQTLDRGTQLDDVRARFELALALADAVGNRATYVETLFEYGLVLASTNQVRAAEQHIDEAHLLALEHGLSVDEGATVFVRGVQALGENDHEAAAGHFRAAADQFRVEGRLSPAAIALSRCAFALDDLVVPEEELIGVADGRILAHSEAIVAWREVPQPAVWQHQTLAHHLERRALLCAQELLRCAAPGPPDKAGLVMAIGFMHEAREEWARIGSSADVARTEFGLGNFWLLLDSEQAARQHFERARDGAPRGDTSGVRAGASAALVALDGLGQDVGPELT